MGFVLPINYKWKIKAKRGIKKSIFFSKIHENKCPQWSECRFYPEKSPETASWKNNFFFLNFENRLKTNPKNNFFTLLGCIGRQIGGVKLRLLKSFVTLHQRIVHFYYFWIFLTSAKNFIGSGCIFFSVFQCFYFNYLWLNIFFIQG